MVNIMDFYLGDPGSVHCSNAAEIAPLYKLALPSLCLLWLIKVHPLWFNAIYVADFAFVLI